MMSDIGWVTLGLACATFGIRISGILLGRRIPQTGFWARALQGLPGSLIVALVTMSLMSGSIEEWLASGVALLVAIRTRSLPLVMLCGIVTICVLRAI
ncbi:AzlD family protein [Aliamphritea spongicola]|uniref:AzlD family protein n=1 Tax=Aliamphritea spongicola TaxID=707589 RepID=UPI00196B9138|nr:AzlD domain-containing protein [Aliamphritea spongicola]MBN3560794.1 AzlD domain-containing protein [Aliamphritea spongicola]